MDASCTVTLADGGTTMDAVGTCDDGSDESIVSPCVAERAVLQGIGRMTAIRTIELQVALKDGERPQSFKFSRTRAHPHTVLNLAAGQLALLIVAYYVADTDLFPGDLIIGLPVLKHLKVDTCALPKTSSGRRSRRDRPPMSRRSRLR